MVNFYTLKPYLIESVYSWCVDNNLGVYIEINENQLGVKKLFDISNNYIANLLFEEEGISFITIINKQEKQLFINYNDIEKIFSKITGQGLDFSGMELNNINNTNNINTNTNTKNLKLIKYEDIKKNNNNKNNDNILNIINKDLKNEEE